MESGSNESPRPASGEPPPDSEAEEQGPVGTLFLMVVYLIVLAGMWGTIYWMMLER